MKWERLPILLQEAEEFGKVNIMTHGCPPKHNYSVNIEFDMGQLANLNCWSHSKTDLEEAMVECIGKAKVLAERVMRPMPPEEASKIEAKDEEIPF